MKALQIDSVERYVRILDEQPDEADLLFNDLLIGVTEFFRDPEAFNALFKLMTVRSFKGGEEIIKEGEPGTDFFILADGSASVFKKTQDGDLYKVAILAGHMGAFFGESGLLESDTRTATIRAETEVQCLVLTKNDFESYCNANPQWALPILKRVAKAIMNRLKNMNHDLGLLYKALVDEFAQR